MALYTIFSAEVKIADFVNGVDVGQFLHQTGISSALRARRSREVVKQSKCFPPLQTKLGCPAINLDACKFAKNFHAMVSRNKFPEATNHE